LPFTLFPLAQILLICNRPNGIKYPLYDLRIFIYISDYLIILSNNFLYPCCPDPGRFIYDPADHAEQSFPRIIKYGKSTEGKTAVLCIKKIHSDIWMVEHFDPEVDGIYTAH
jgi:hypothetical protein